jgi:hypothetical protein
MPAVSVIMPVFDVAPFVEQTVRSVLAQTFSDLELIVVDDGSSDDTARIVESIGDPRVRLIREGHRGYVAATNRGIELATGECLARADGDDIYHPTLFQKELDVLRAEPGTVAVGTWIRQFGGLEDCWKLPTEPDAIRRFLRYGCALSQPVMMRTGAFHEVGGLRAVSWEDWDLWIRLAARADLRNVPEFLILRRFRPTSVYHSPGRVQRRRANLRARWTAARMLGVDRHSGFVLARNVASLPVYRAIDRFLPAPPPPPRVLQDEPTVSVVVAVRPDEEAAASIDGADEVLTERDDDPCRAYAAGVSRARHDVVAFLEGSSAPDADWLGEVRRSFLDLSVGMVGGRTAPPEPIETESGPVEDPGPDHYGEVVSVPISNAAVRRDLAADVLRGGGEAVRRHGLRILFNPWMLTHRVGVPASAP